MAPKQTLAIAGPVDDKIVFAGTAGNKPFVDNRGISKNTKLFILSIGINNYNFINAYAFKNCDADAKLFTETMKTAMAKK
jgi:hypothetical protein